MKKNNVNLIQNIVENCPIDIKNSFDDILFEIKEAYKKRFGNNSKLIEYMEYSRGWHYLIFQEVSKYKKGINALDVGSLFGATSIFMAKRDMNVTALDGYVDELADDLKMKYEITFIFSNLESNNVPPLHKNYFDLVINE